ncbi:amidohydrolase [Actinotalea fermentans]|uniref:Amidohydrolase n=1 Tax=Actinotalea fermentans TaxID=43671 RepID=A0A511YWH3_9CELL|nr:amidohydrolase family protein [Actinotalea fermentans]GEN79519.1 amidohydrolase [Actinotalea fermentans]
MLSGARLLGQDPAVDVLVRGGVVTAIVPAGHAPTDSSGLERVALDGRFVMPGLWDQHVHLTQWASFRQRLDLYEARSAAEAVAMVKARLEESPPPPGRPLLGRRFRAALWPDEPTAALLDDAVGDVPVVLASVDLHSGWLSSAGLRWFGAPGHPTGLLREEEWLPRLGAMDVAPDVVLDAWVREAATAAAARGVVGVVDFELADNVGSWRRRAGAGFDLLRVRAGVWEDRLDGVIDDGLRTGDRIAGTVTQGPLKVISDGSLNTRTAWCHDPYPDGGRGILNVPPERLVPLMARAHAAGLACAIHAIGDAANTLVLDAFAATGARGSVEHAQLLSRRDVPRFAALGVTASVQPEHALDDRDVTDSLWADRADRAYLFRDLHDAGARLVLGSDAPVAALDPWAAIAAAVTRTRDGREPWQPAQSLPPRVALAASTDGRGLAPTVGVPADLVVLEADPLALLEAGEGERVRAMGVAGTLLDGRWTFRSF